MRSLYPLCAYCSFPMRSSFPHTKTNKYQIFGLIEPSQPKKYGRRFDNSCCYPMRRKAQWVGLCMHSLFSTLYKSSWYFFNKAQSNIWFDTCCCYPMRRRETLSAYKGRRRRLIELLALFLYAESVSLLRIGRDNNSSIRRRDTGLLKKDQEGFKSIG